MINSFISFANINKFYILGSKNYCTSCNFLAAVAADRKYLLMHECISDCSTITDPAK